MGVTLIAENRIDIDDFFTFPTVKITLDADTEQGGPRWSLPESYSSAIPIVGGLRPVISGTPANDTYTGETTSDGAGDGSTLIDTLLGVYGSDYWIGATVTITSGDCDGETSTVDDYDRATATITVDPVFTAQIVSGVTFTVTRSYKGYLEMEMQASGDQGTATFDWLHYETWGGSAADLGRNSPNQATWLYKQTVEGSANASAGKVALLDLQENGVLAFLSDAAGNLDVYITEDNGASWSAQGTIAVSNALGAVVRLSTGRILAAVNTVMYYSDDLGATWTAGSTISAFTGLCELRSGAVFGVYGTSSISAKVSTDGGFTWGSAITVVSVATSGSQSEADVCLNADGDLVCVYKSDEDSGGSDEIKCKISTDGGATWGTSRDVINYDSDMSLPSIMLDIDNSLYVVAVKASADTTLVLSRSTDGGTTWSTGSILTVATAGSTDYTYPSIALIYGVEVWVLFDDDTNDDVCMVRRGIWESGSTCPCAPRGIKQRLQNGAIVTWYGAAGVDGDKYRFYADHTYGVTNLIADSPTACWRSTQDETAMNIVVNTGPNYIDSVAFFNCNLRSFSFQAHTSNSWGAPSVDETVSFDLTTAGEVDAAITDTEVKDAALLANYKDHELKGCFLRFTSGNLSGYTFTIADNVGDYILTVESIQDYESTYGDVAVSDTFAIFQNHVAVTFTGGFYPYIRIAIPSQHCPEVYEGTVAGAYQIGSMVVGAKLQLTDAFGIGYGRNHEYGIEQLRTRSGGLIPVMDYNRKRRFRVGWEGSETGREELLALLDYLEGKNIALVLDNTDLADCHLVKLIGTVTQTQQFLNVFQVELEFEEVL